MSAVPWHAYGKVPDAAQLCDRTSLTRDYDQLALTCRRAPGGSCNFPSARLCVITVAMALQETVITRKRGPKPSGKGELVGVRLQPEALSDLDLWAAAQTDFPSRPEAIRRLIRWGLKATLVSR
jgi:hypothetical protein